VLEITPGNPRSAGGDLRTLRTAAGLSLRALAAHSGYSTSYLSRVENGRRAITLVRVARHFADWTLLDVTLKTGRTHQIRVHLADAGHPIAGDDKYGDRALNRSLARGGAVPETRFERMFLHAKGLRFAHPASGEPMALEAPLPAACVRLLDALPTPMAASA